MNFIIDFEPSASQAQIDQYLADNGLTTVVVYDNFENVYLVSGSQPPQTEIVTSIIDDDANIIQLLGDVVHIVDDAPEITFNSTDQHWWKIYSLRKVDLDADSVTMKRKGAAANVYLLDSGIDATHPEFDGVTIENLFSVTGSFEDSTGHGTALASLIAGKTCAISNPNLKIVKIFDQSGEVKQSQLLAAMDAVINDVLANPSRKVSIANMSWAIAKNSYIEQKLSIMMANDVIVVAAAGNSGVAIEDVTPASMDKVITVGAYNQDLAPCNFSNYTGESVITYTDGSTNGGALDGWAPGEMIFVAQAGGGYGFAVGTSVAAAIHSGICAYNGMQKVLADGSVLECGADLAQHTKDMSLARQGLIQYGDAKYDNSINKISTCFNEFTESQRVPRLEENVPCVSNTIYCRRLFHPMFAKSYEVIGSLPPGFEIYNGTLHGKYPLEAELDYKLFQFQVKITSVDDMVIDQQVNVIVRQPEFNFEDLPQDDPTLSVMTLIDYCTGFGCGSCDTDEACGCGNPKAGGCECLCNGCDCP